MCGWGIHPLNGVSTSPMFYSALKQNGYSLAERNLIKETEQIKIGNDVFIGMNVTILDGVTIGNGAVVGAGTVVAKDVPAYAIVVGVPMKVLKYRFDPETIIKLEAMKWWNWDYSKLSEINRSFFNVKDFVNDQK
jgi:acetyltransferase-like isoleucine patch superfamily enzyme